MTLAVVSDSFDNLRSRQVRFLEESARTGSLHVLLWSDDLVRALTGSSPKFPQAERQYFVESIRYVDRVSLIDHLDSQDCLPDFGKATSPIEWVVLPEADSSAKRAFCESRGIGYHIVEESLLHTFPQTDTVVNASNNKKVLVTGCYDWLHTGHVRFFEEVSQLGDLYVVVGNDPNVLFLKGEGHPLFKEDERRYMVQSIRYVTQALISSGMGWLDAEPEIQRVHPDRYAVNEDGDKPEKRAYCEVNGIEYVVLKRIPKAGLPKRESTQLRGF